MLTSFAIFIVVIKLDLLRLGLAELLAIKMSKQYQRLLLPLAILLLLLLLLFIHDMAILLRLLFHFHCLLQLHLLLLLFFLFPNISQIHIIQNLLQTLVIQRRFIRRSTSRTRRIRTRCQRNCFRRSTGRNRRIWLFLLVLFLLLLLFLLFLLLCFRLFLFIMFTRTLPFMSSWIIRIDEKPIMRQKQHNQTKRKRHRTRRELDHSIFIPVHSHWNERRKVETA
mmetsp:Transcript_26028/g.41284  ORF Transcript_26028/g.41284 Transcript_26028/m.41284 type:complete len:224 (+) Transcript_26028:306-977(+)